MIPQTDTGKLPLIGKNKSQIQFTRTQELPLTPTSPVQVEEAAKPKKKKRVVKLKPVPMTDEPCSLP